MQGIITPTEMIFDKISPVFQYAKGILLHVLRPVRWDSDHGVIVDDELRAIAAEILRIRFEDRVHIGLDFFDAIINRVAAWANGARNMAKALLYAVLEPTEKLQEMERRGDYTSRLAYLEELKTDPFSAVWNYYCENSGVPARDSWIADVQDYEKNVLSYR